MNLLAIIKQERIFLCFVFVFSFFVRSLLFYAFLQHDNNSLIYFDSQQYHDLAIQIAQGKGITQPEGTPQHYRLPGYSLFLALCYKLFNFSIKKALLTQIIIMSFIPLLIFFLALILFDNLLLAKLSGIFGACHLGLILYSGMLATETPFLLFFLFFLIFFLPFITFNFWPFNEKKKIKPNLWLIFLSGIFLGIASLIRPVGHFALMLSLFLLCISSHTVKTKLSASALCAFGWFLVTGWWLIRNYLATGFLFFTSMGGCHFLQYSAVNVVMHTEHERMDKAKQKLYEQWGTKCKEQEALFERPLNEYERCRIGEKIAISYLLKHPLIALKHCFIQMTKTCCALYSTQMILSDTGVWPDCSPHISLWTKMKRYFFPKIKTKFLIPLIYYDILILLITLLGFMLFLISTWWDFHARIVASKLIPYLALFIFLTLAYGCARLRLPIEPLFFIPALYAWLSLLVNQSVK